MDNVNKTLYIPLYGKSYVSRRGMILDDPKAEEIWAAEGFPLKGKSRSKWLAFYMGMRAKVFDRWVQVQLAQSPEAIVVHIGCGMDSRCHRVGGSRDWYDVDFPDVAAERRRYFRESETYHILSGDARNPVWLEELPRGNAVVILEGVSMYLRSEELTRLLSALCAHFNRVSVLMDCYTELAVRASKLRNPIQDVGVTQVYGMDTPDVAETATLRFVREWEMTPADLVNELHGLEKTIFRTLYAGAVARSMYRLYEFTSPANATP